MMKDSLPVHLIIPSIQLAGVEKRLISFWLYSQKNYQRDFFLVTTKTLYEKFCDSPESATIIDYRGKVIFIDSSSSRFQSLKIARKYLKEHRSSAVMHFVLWYPLNMSLKKDRILYTFPGYDLSYLSAAKKAVLYSSFLKARRSDILDPGIYKKMKRKFPFKKHAFNLTPNSVVNVEEYKANFEQKENWIVFLGRFVDHKQIIEFVRAIPAIHRKLKEGKIEGVKFYLLGSGEKEEEVKRILSEDEYKGIDIFSGFVYDPQTILERSKIILSIQLYNNYPSRSLLEAMAAGNMPVVTDVGNTELIAKKEFSAYVKRNFSPAEIAGAIHGLLSGPDNEQLEKMKKARQFVAENCRMENMAAYFYSLYEQL
jgi:glycosyltransferase involved in cell wall biosynthesis